MTGWRTRIWLMLPMFKIRRKANMAEMHHKIKILSQSISALFRNLGFFPAILGKNPFFK